MQEKKMNNQLRYLEKENQQHVNIVYFLVI